MSSSTSPVIAFTVALGDSAQAEARMCEASFRHWHPDVPFLIIDDAAYRLISGGSAPAWGGEIVAMRALIGWFLSRHARRVVHLDADLFVLGRLDELLDAPDTTLTADWSTFTMRVPECPRINAGVLASSDAAFWPTWTAAQFSLLAPALNQCDFDQLALRLLVMAGSAPARVIDGQPGRPYYNVSISEQPGEWRVEQGATFKGAERALILHQAGWEKRGIAAADPALHAHLTELTRERPDAGAGPTLDFAAWWQADGESFSQTVAGQFAGWPINTLEGVVPDVYARTPGAFRSLAPIAHDRHRKMDGSGWERMFKREWQAYLYTKAGPA
jgi:hypothetical protein